MTDRPRHSGKQSSAQIKKDGESEELVATIQSISLESSFPPVAWLRECDLLCPGFAKRYLDDFVEERQTITTVEIEHVRHTHTIQLRGQNFGLTIGLAGIFGSFAVSYLAKDPVTASILGGSTVVCLVAAFVTGRLANPKSDKEDEKSAPKSVPKNIGKNG